MTDTLDIATVAKEIGGNVYDVTVKPTESKEDRGARIRHETRVFWMGQIWTGIVVFCLGAVMFICFLHVRDADAALAQWARASVLTILTSGIAFVAGRLSASR